MKFKSLDEVNHYFSGETVECLECQKFFHHLANHVMMKHHIKPDEYKAKYNIPLTYSLSGQSYKKKQSRALTKRIQSGDFNYSHLPKAVKKAKTAPRTRTKINRTKNSADYLLIRDQLIKILKSLYFNRPLNIETLNKDELKKIFDKAVILLSINKKIQVNLL